MKNLNLVLFLLIFIVAQFLNVNDHPCSNGEGKMEAAEEVPAGRSPCLPCLPLILILVQYKLLFLKSCIWSSYIEHVLK